MAGPRPNAGRKPGSSNVKTLTAELAAVREKLAAEQARQRQGRKRGTEVLDDIMHVAYGMMAMYQPQAPGEALAPGRKPNPAEFKEWLKLTKEAAEAIAPYQSAKLKAIIPLPEAPPGAMSAAESAPAPSGVVTRMSAQEAYRLLRDSSDLIDLKAIMPPVAEQPIAERLPKKAKRT